MQRVSGFVQQGNTTVTTGGLNSTNVVEGSFPSSTVSVFATGTQNLISIFSDNNSTPKANPFTAGSDGSFFFYCLNQRVDIQFSGTGITTPFTIGDVLVSDSATPGVGFQTVTFSATPTFDLSKFSWFLITLTGDVTAPVFSNAVSGDLLFLSIIQDATGGHAFTFPAAFTNPPTVAQGASNRSDYIFAFDGTNWRHFADGDNAYSRSALLAANNSTNLAALTFSQPIIAGSGSSAAPPYPMAELGNLLLVARGAGATRDIAFATGNPPVFGWKFDRNNAFTSLAANPHTWVASTDLSVTPDSSITRAGVNSLKIGMTAGTPDASGTLFVTALNNGGPLALPTSADTLVARATADTLTNKTLTSPVINGTPTGTGIPTVTLKKGTGGGNYSTSSTSYVQVDGTNLTLTVTIPSGWKLMIHASGVMTVNTALTNIGAAIADGGTVVVEQIISVPTAANTDSAFALNWIINGDGASHSVDLRFKTTNGADAAVIQNSTATQLPVMTFLLTPSN